MQKERIRPIVICLFRSGDRILVFEGHDAAKGEYFCRPLGGGIEFGEHSLDALRREIREELNAEIENPRFIGVLENIFIYKGRQGHEMVFVYDAEFTDKSLYEREELAGCEHEIGVDFVARWQSLEEMNRRNVRLVPETIIDLLTPLKKESPAGGAKKAGVNREQ